MNLSLPWQQRADEAVETPLRGAVRSMSESAPARDSDWYWKPFVLLTLLLVFCGIAFSALRDGWRWLDQPVAKIQIEGATRHLDKQSIAHGLVAAIDAPLLDLDLARLRTQLISDPWVHDASISRQWPPALKVNLVEEVPVARWGDKGLLNHQGDIFWPELKPEYRHLPMLSGPAHETVRIMEEFHDLNRLFAGSGLRLAGLSLEARGAWTLELDNGVRVVVGREHLMARLRRFLTVYQLELAPRADQIEQIDIRYTNGIAVRWRAEEKDNDAG